jgi:hypothetical protein
MKLRIKIKGYINHYLFRASLIPASSPSYPADRRHFLDFFREAVNSPDPSVLFPRIPSLILHSNGTQGKHGTTIFDPVPSGTLSLYNGTLGTDGTFAIRVFDAL